MVTMIHPTLPDQPITVDPLAVWHYERSGWEVAPDPEPEEEEEESDDETGDPGNPPTDGNASTSQTLASPLDQKPPTA